jgi:hypothetical protein
MWHQCVACDRELCLCVIFGAWYIAALRLVTYSSLLLGIFHAGGNEEGMESEIQVRWRIV